MEKDQELLETIIKAIVKTPADVKIERQVDQRGVFLKLWVDKADMGLVIGKGGKNASAIKLLLKLMGYNHNVMVSLKIEEPLNE